MSTKKKATKKKATKKKATKKKVTKKKATKKKATKKKLVPADEVRVFACLDRLYEGATTALDWQTPVQLLVATILSAQCTDDRVNMVTPGLFKAYPTAAALAAAPIEDLEEAIHSTGFFRNKARSIHGACSILEERHGGEIPAEMDALLELPGVARKTANVVLGTAFGLAFGVVVDTHVKRLAGRLGWSQHDDPTKIERDLMALVPQERWIRISHQLILHGRAVCNARKPRCGECSLADVCPSADISGS